MAVALHERRGPEELWDLDEIGIRLTTWTPGRYPIPLTNSDARHDAVLLAEVACDANPFSVSERLTDLCPGLELEMVEDLVCPDALPGPKRSSEDGPVRGVAVGRCVVRHGIGALAWEMIELLAGDGWLVVCRHRAELGVDLTARVKRRWARGPFTSAGDLGVLFMREIAESYAVALVQLEAAHEAWEVTVIDSDPKLDDYGHQTLPLRGLRKEVAEFRKQVSGINVRRDDAQGAWFADVTDAGSAANRVDEIVDHTLGELRALSDCLRSSWDLLTSRVATRQAKIAERTQKRLDLITAVFLVPTLVAGFFGANTFLPGGNSTRATSSFEVMVAAMIIGSLVVGTTLWWLRRRAEEST